jgi:hypothetical protein
MHVIYRLTELQKYVHHQVLGKNPDSKNPDSKNPDTWQVGKNPDSKNTDGKNPDTLVR